LTSAGYMNFNGVTVVAAAPPSAAATNRVSITAHGLVDGDLITVENRTGGALELRLESEYVVRDPTANDFRISTPSGAEMWDFDSDGTADILLGVPSYTAQQMRRIGAISLHPGNGDRLGARVGVRPHSSDPVTIAGTTYSAAEGLAVVYPRLTSTSAPYVVEYDATNGSVNPPDASNPRLDAVDLQVQDDDEDGSGQRRARIVYVPGTPAGSPVAPTLTVNSMRLAVLRVNSTASGLPHAVETLAQYAFGPGVLPVRSTSERPTTGRFHGMMVWRQDTSVMEVWTGAAWVSLASPTNFASVRRLATTIRTTNSAGFTSETVINTVTASLVSGATYRITWDMCVSSTILNDRARMRLREDNISGNQLQLRHVTCDAATVDFPAVVQAEFTAVSTGSKTFAGTAIRQAGTGTLACNANANQPQYLYVDYIRG
jgi:hypothetical protein